MVSTELFIIQRELVKRNYQKHKIKFSLRFTTGQSYSVSGSPDELFQSVIDQMIKENNLSNIKDKIKGAIFEAKKIDFNKTIKENEIKDGSIILLVIGDIEIRKNNNLNTEKSLTDSVSTKASIYDLISDLDELSGLVLLSLYKKYINRLENSEKIFLARSSRTSRCNGIRECTHVHSFRHKHRLVLLFSNRN